MDVIVFGCGLYILYGYFLMVKKNELKEGILLPANMEQKKCKDLEAYKRYIGPRTLFLGISALISGGAGLYEDYLGKLPQAVYLGSLILFFAALVFFMVSVRKAVKNYW